MSNLPNEDSQSPQVRRLHEWWVALPLPYRVNALLYALGGVALVFLLVTLLSDDGSDVQVGAGVTPTSVATTVPARPATTPPPVATTASSTSSSSSTSPSSTSPPTSAAATATTRAAGTNTTGSQNPTTTRPPDTTSPTTTTTMPANCRNSTNPACGSFVWDPAPAGNAPLLLSAAPLEQSYKVGAQVFFKVTASDPDRAVTDNCSEVTFDNGTGYIAPCNQPASCPDRYGPWTPPPATPGPTHSANYINIWNTPGQHTATFKFRSALPDVCASQDPYASQATVTATVTITE